jgi:GNAT superfamily N-acetyltransferase
MIRDIVPGDWDGWKAMWDLYLRFYGEELPEATSRATFGRLCRRADGMFGSVVESGGAVVGLVHAVVHATTWSPRPTCYLEDLYVDRSARGSGTGRALIDTVIAEARSRGATVVYWHTQEFNAPARRVYDRVARLNSWVVYEVGLEAAGPDATGADAHP